MVRKSLLYTLAERTFSYQFSLLETVRLNATFLALHLRFLSLRLISGAIEKLVWTGCSFGLLSSLVICIKLSVVPML
jgi:hypothetical protein